MYPPVVQLETRRREFFRELQVRRERDRAAASPGRSDRRPAETPARGRAGEAVAGPCVQS
ncbi:MAG TPA: hypothetical protein VK915_06970 [Gaiellaceae bacterium]|nr:hypothetical protein [Gaiellaceae bacterium]